MAENSKISWTDHTLSGVLSLMAIVAQRKAVGNLKAKFGKIGEWFYVVSAKVSTCRIAAFLTSKFVADENIESPAFVCLAESFISALRQLPVLVAVAGFAAYGVLAGTFAYVNSIFNGAWPSPVIVAAALWSPHAGTIGKLLAFHWMNPRRISLAVCPQQFHLIGAIHG